MKLSVCTIEKVLFKGEAEKVIAMTPMGQITVLDNHLPLITTVLGPSIEIIEKDNKKNIVEIASGFLEVRPQSEVVILSNL